LGPGIWGGDVIPLPDDGYVWQNPDNKPGFFRGIGDDGIAGRWVGRRADGLAAEFGRVVAAGLQIPPESEASVRDIETVGVGKDAPAGVEGEVGDREGWGDKAGRV